MDEVRTHSTDGSSNCALVLGPFGGDLASIQPQVDMYTGFGLSTVSTTGCIFPYVLHQRQLQELGEAGCAAIREDTKLVVHMCSSNGISTWCRVIMRWHKRIPPFDKWPPLSRTWAAMIYESGPSACHDSYGQVIVPPWFSLTNQKSPRRAKMELT